MIDVFYMFYKQMDYLLDTLLIHILIDIYVFFKRTQDRNA